LSGPEAETEEPQEPLPQPTGVVDFDFDGDGKADIGRWNAPTTNFRIKNSSSGSITNHTIGSTSAVSAPGRFDANSQTDAAVFDSGSWSITLSGGGTQSISLGQSGDKPVPADYDRDGITDA